MAQLIPSINAEQYEIELDTWRQLKTEIQKAKEKIDNNTIVPEDVQEIRKLKTKIDNFVSGYRSEITKAAAEYKRRVSLLLEKIEYNTVENFIAEKNKQRQQAISDRLTSKVNQFNTIYNDVLESKTLLKRLTVRYDIAQTIMKRFPNINSGDAKKDIKDWEPIKQIIILVTNKVEDYLKQYPIILELPSQSQTVRGLVNFAKDNDDDKLNITELLKQDRSYIEDITMLKQISTKEIAIEQIKKVIERTDITDDMKLRHIQKLVQIGMNAK